MEHSKAFMLKHGKKASFFDCHRRFLPMDHPYRRNRINFKKGKVEMDEPPPNRSGLVIQEWVDKLPEIVFGPSVHKQKIRGFGKEHNWVRKSIFWELPYWKTLLIRHMLDLMHIEKNFHDNVFYTVLGDKTRTKDNAKARLDMQEICSRDTGRLMQNNDGIGKPKAAYTLSDEDLKSFCEWVKELRLPDGFASNISKCVSTSDCKFGGLKTHDCHVLMQKLLPIGLRGMVPNNVWDALTEASNFFRDLCSSVLRHDKLDMLHKSIVETLCKLEKVFPPAFFDSMEHLPIHLPYEAKCGGPVQYRWMYPFER